MRGDETLPEGWKSARLGELADVRLGKMLSDKARDVALIHRPYLRNENVRWGTIDTSDVKTMGFKPEEIERYSVQPGDLLACEGGEPGRCAIYRGPANALMYQKALHRVRTGADLSPGFLLYFLRHLAGSGALAPRIAQTTIQHLPLERFREIIVPAPSRADQDRIVAAIEEHFSYIDAGVAALERALANLKRYRAAVLKAACEGKLVPTEAELARREGRAYESADVLLRRILVERRARWEAAELEKMRAKGKRVDGDEWKKRYVEPAGVSAEEARELGALPEGWCWARVATVGDVVLGRQRAPQYLTGKWPRPYLRVANVKDDALDLSDIETMDFDPAHLAKYRLVDGDIVVSEGQSPELVGQSAIYRGTIDGLCFQKTLHRFRSVPPGPSPEFAQIVFRSHVKSGLFEKLASITTNIAHLTLEKFEAAPFPLPPASEQARIVVEVDRLLSIANAVDRALRCQLARATRLRQGVLRSAFEGQSLRAAGRGGGVNATLAIRADDVAMSLPT